MELSLSDKFSKALDAAARKLKAFGESVTNIGKKTLALGSAITAPLLIAAQRFSAMGDEVNKASQRTGIAVEALGELKYAGEQSGASFEVLQGGLRKMQKTMFDAAEGTAEAVDALAAVGLTVEELKDLSPDQQFQLIGDRLNNITDASARTAVAMEIFGKGGTSLLPMFAAGAEGMQALRDRARELGIVFGQEDADAATKFGDSLSDVWKQLNAVVFEVGAAVVQTLQPFADTVHRILRSVIDWARANRGLIFTVLTVGAGLMALGGTLIGLGLAIKVVGVALGGITAAVGAVGTVIGLLTNPIVLVIVALAALAAYLLIATENGGKLLDWLSGKFNTLAETAKTAFGGIADALAAGNIALAAQILWAGLKLAWAQGTQELQAKWSQFKAGLVKTAVQAFYGVLSAWAIAQGGLQKLWAQTAAGFVNTWHKAVIEVTKLFDFIDREERDREKIRLRRQLERKDLAPNVRAALELQLAGVDAHGDQAKAARDQKDREEAAEREKALQDRIAAIDAERDRKLIENIDAEKALSAAADAVAKQEIADLQKNKEELERQLKALRDQAGDERRQKEDEGPPPLVDSSKLSDLDDVLDRRQKIELKDSSAGLFNVAGLQSLAGNRTQEEIAKNTAATAKHVKKIADNQRPLMFG